MRLIRIHLRYLLSRKSVIIIMLCFMFLFLFFIIKANDVKNFPSDVAINNYFSESTYIIKLFYYFIVIYIWFNSFSFKNLNYYYLLVPHTKRVKFIFYKCLVLVMLSFVFILIIYMIFNIVGKTLINGYEFHEKLLDYFFIILLVSIIYGLFTVIIQLVAKNEFILIVGYMGSILSIISENELEKNVIPNVNMEKYILIIIIKCLMLILFMWFSKMDLNE